MLTGPGLSDPLARHLLGQIAGCVVLLEELRTRMGSTISTLVDVAEGVVVVPELGAKAAALFAAGAESDAEQVDRVRAQLVAIGHLLRRGCDARP